MSSGHDDLTCAVQGPDGILDQAAMVLRRKLAANPHDAKALLRLGDVHRCRGELAAALDTYRRLQALEPGHVTAAWLVSILNGDGTPDRPPPGDRPVPFVRMTDFLTPAQQGLLFPLLAGRERFRPAQVGKTVVDRATRTAFVADGRILRDVRSWFCPKLRGVLPQVLARLRTEEISAQRESYRIELDVTAHVAGGFYKIHRDDSEDFNLRRKLSFVYYFHRRPRRFAGGDLLLHDTDFDNHLASLVWYTRIEPLHNSAVFFPSAAFHQITPVECDTRDFADGRFTVNGWIRARGGNDARRRTGQGDAAGAAAPAACPA